MDKTQTPGKVNIRLLIISIIIPLAVGGLSAILTRQGISDYGNLAKPGITPPAILFPIVWTILYILMGVSSYLVLRTDTDLKSEAVTVYAVSLVLNFLWSQIFFNKNSYLAAFIILIFLWISICITIYIYGKINKTAAILQIPYLLWVTFAGYLNYSVYLLNG